METIKPHNLSGCVGLRTETVEALVSDQGLINELLEFKTQTNRGEPYYWAPIELVRRVCDHIQQKHPEVTMEWPGDPS